MATEDNELFRVDVVFDGAVEGADHFWDYKQAKEQFDNHIQELAASSPEYDWEVDLWLEHSDDNQELIDNHNHEAETLYNVTFTVQVYADDPGSAEANAKDYLEQHVPDGKVEVAWLQ